jgi:hypothetical protein
MSKPAITILTIAVFMLAVILAVLALHAGREDRRQRNDGTATRSAEPTPTFEPSAAPMLPRVAATRTEPSPSTSPIPADPGPPTSAKRTNDSLLGESSLISRLHDLAASDPPQSLALAREAVARFPDSANAAEFEWNVVKALANMDRYKEAEQEAARMVQRFPGNAFSEDVEHHLLNHPPNPPSVPVP